MNSEYYFISSFKDVGEPLQKTFSLVFWYEIGITKNNNSMFLCSFCIK